MSRPPVVSIHEVSKRFGATVALAGVTLDLFGGEVHALAGENGAGKSTLMRILAGVLGADEGEIRVRGEVVRFSSPVAARRAGVVTIHQELSLVGSMSVADNIALVDDAPSWRRIRPAAELRRAREVLALLSLDVDPAVTVASLPLATRQLIEVARALSRDARVLILDEPTSALSDAEVERLFAHLCTLRERGVAIVFISHRMDEIYRVADRITVLRDGQLVVTAAAEDLPRDELVRHMVGEELAREPSGTTAAREQTLLCARVGTVNVEVAAGEVLGITGLHGSGAGDVPRAIFGAIAADVEVEVAGERIVNVSPRSCIARGVILLAGDRSQSLVQSLSVTANTTLSSLSAVWRDRGRERQRAGVARDRLRIDCPSLDADVCTLSGGNQQKVALARCLETKPRVLLLAEPSRGIDVGAKAEVHALIGELAASGVCILVVGTDLDELMAVTDRLLVMSRGDVVLELSRPDYSRARILAAAMGSAA